MSRVAIIASWSDVPHITEENQQSMLSAYAPHERDARSKGIPQLGSGAIYPVPEEDIICEPFEIPAWYRISFGLDVGWKRTAAIWSALNPETDVLYLFHEYYRGQAEPAIHAQALKAPGAWIPGVIDPAANGRSQVDGQQLMLIYQGLGLQLSKADNSVESGIYDTWTRLSSGRLKVFKHLENWKTEYRIYRRDDKGKVVKSMDHLMDATRYDVKSGIAVARQKPHSDWAPTLRRARHTFDYNPMAEAYNINPTLQ